MIGIKLIKAEIIVHINTAGLDIGVTS